jgi:hypothetical protein
MVLVVVMPMGLSIIALIVLRRLARPMIPGVLGFVTLPAALMCPIFGSAK